MSIFRAHKIGFALILAALVSLEEINCQAQATSSSPTQNPQLGAPPATDAVVPRGAASSPWNGTWKGTWKNSLGESGEDSLMLTEDANGNLSGDWLGMTVSGKQIETNTATLVSHTSNRSYTATAKLDNGTLTLTYVSKRLDAEGGYEGVSTLTHENTTTASSPLVTKALVDSTPAPPMAADTQWVGILNQEGIPGDHEFSIEVTKQSGEKIEGIVRFSFPGNNCVIRFKGSVRGQAVFLTTYEPVAGNPTFPGFYEGSITGHSVTGKWSVPFMQQQGEFQAQKRDK